MTSTQQPVRRRHTAARKHLVTIADAADYLAVTPLTIRRRIQAGELKAYRVGPRIVRVDLNEIDALLEPVGGVA